MSTLLQVIRPIRIAETISGLDIVVAGSGANTTEIDLSRNSIFFSGRSSLPSRLCFEDLKLSNGRGTSGAIQVIGKQGPESSQSNTKLSMNRCHINECTAQVNSPILVLELAQHRSFAGNGSMNLLQIDGGALDLHKAALVLQSCTLTGNKAGSGRDGGAIHLWMSTAKLSSSTLRGNVGNFGGAIKILDSHIELNSCTLSDNVARDKGGAIALNNSTANLCSCTLTNNNAVSGGAMFTEKMSQAELTSCTLQGNRAQWGGGAMSITTKSSAELNSCLLIENIAQLSGGALFIYTTSWAKLRSCMLSKNAAGDSGGALALLEPNSHADLSSCTLQGNNALKRGGALNVWGATLSLFSCTLVSNRAKEGGAISLLAAKGGEFGRRALLFSSLCLHDNTAHVGGAMYALNSSIIVLFNSTVGPNSQVAISLQHRSVKRLSDLRTVFVAALDLPQIFKHVHE